MSADDVRRLDAAHEEAWRSLADDQAALGGAAAAAARHGLAAPPGNPRSVSERADAVSGPVRLPRGDSSSALESQLEASYADALAQGLADERAAAAVDVSPAPSAEAAALGTAYAEMERVWQSLSLQEKRAAEGALHTDAAADFDAVWQSLKGGDYEASWDALWHEGAAADGAAAAGALGAGDAEAPYRFHSE